MYRTRNRKQLGRKWLGQEKSFEADPENRTLLLNTQLESWFSLYDPTRVEGWVDLGTTVMVCSQLYITLVSCNKHADCRQWDFSPGISCNASRNITTSPLWCCCVLGASLWPAAVAYFHCGTESHVCRGISTDGDKEHQEAAREESAGRKGSAGSKGSSCRREWLAIGNYGLFNCVTADIWYVTNLECLQSGLLNCQTAPSVNTFKTRLKTFLFASA